MKKKLLFLLLALFSVGLAFAEPVDLNRARQVAVNFLKSTEKAAQQLTADDLTDITSTTPFHEFYVFRVKDNGFILVSGDDRALPILGYSLDNQFVSEGIPAHVKWWLDNYEEQIAQLRDEDVPPTESIMLQWRQYTENSGSPVSLDETSVAPLLTTTWNQSPYYNSMCPTDNSSSSGHAVAGCVAIATAQVMKYWNWPTTGRESHSYTHSTYGTLSANFATTYSWSNMPNSLTSSSSSTQINAVAKLVYHVGVAVDMDYGPSSSGAVTGSTSLTSNSANNALVKYFKYKSSLAFISMSDYTLAEWKNIIISELDNSRPVIYAGSGSGGHAFVCDGYNSSGNFHFNWGWGGWYNGYFAIGSLNPSSYNFNSNNRLIIGIEPNRSTSTTATVNAVANNSSYGSVSGGGTYTPYTDIVSLFATANSGYKFTHWSDGCKYNPRQFYAQGGTSTFTAIFEPLQGDTLTYSIGGYSSTWGNGGSYTWGIKLPPSSLTSGHNLQEVHIYIPYNATFELNVYSGSSQPTTLLHTQTLSSVTTGAWNTVTLSSPVPISGSETLWITFTATGANYPAASSKGCGNSDGFYTYNGSWYSLWTTSRNYGWMIRGIFHQTASTYTITANANPSAGGTVTGGGTYTSGSTCTLRATPASGYSFTNWKSGSTVLSTNATYSFTVTGNKTVTAYFTANTPTSYTITATANPTAGGTVTGGGTYTSGSTCTLRATPASGYSFTNWTSGSTVLSSNPTYSFTVNSSKTIKGNFTRTVSCGINESDLPYTDNFDSYTTSTTAKTGYTLPCWTLAHQDVSMTDEYKPMIYYGSGYAHSGNYSLILNKRGIYAMPCVNMDLNTLQLSFYVRQTQNKYQLQVGVMTDLNDTSTFVPVATINNSSTTDFVLHTVSFANYTGLGHYIAFRNTLASGQSGDYSCNYIDNISLSVNSSACIINSSNLPYTDNFDSYTTSTTAKTGIEPPCWTLAHQDVTMTDEYKPMVYYSSAQAHSGNYSLILNKRGIYTMPRVEADVNSLKLQFYLKQTAVKYQLQVGVMSNLNDASSFVPVATLNNSSTTASMLQTVTFESYNGLGHYIAFRNILASGNSGDYSCNYIDDLTLSVNTAACTLRVADLPFTDNFDSYTTSTTAKTGIEPPCWTLAHQDVVMTEEYKPMVYYSSTNSHSGNYSLILNKRGIYTMPYFEGTVRNLQLSMYVLQSQSKFQLQVGVMSNLDDPSTFVPVATINNSSTSAHVLHTVSFSSYSGNGHYIAFRNILATGYSGDFSCNYIDDITLSNTTTYTITATANPTAGGTVTGGGTFTSGSTCTLRATPNANYTFTNWTSGSTVLSTNATYSFTVTANKTIKANFTYHAPSYTITATANPAAGGTVTGGGTFTSGSTCTLRATPNANYTFTNWTSGSTVLSTNSTYSFTVTSSKTIQANFTYSAPCGISIDDLPYSDNFDSYTTSTTAKTGIMLPCWTLAHQDVSMTNEYKPMIYYSSANAHSGNYSLILNKRGIYAMPEFDGDVNTLKLQFYLKQIAAKYQLQVGVMTNLNDASSFVPVATLNNSSTTTSTLQTVTFESYNGLGHYIAFRNILAPGNSGDYSCNYIDDLTLSVNTAACTLRVADLPYTDNFDSYTTSTTAKTGIEPPCWTLAHQDVVMTDEYKPMVYYSSTNSHSGNYSLILNKRGIYTMPYFNGTVRNLQLSMYVLQSQSKFQLQVGVMSNLDDPSTFLPVATINNSSTSAHVLHTVSFSSYSGNGHYIAFRNILASGYSGDFSCNYIDDITLSNPATYTITVSANPSTGGTVTGGGNYTNGSSCTLRATPSANYTFTNWTSGSTVLSTNPIYSFIVTSSKTIKANFTYNPPCGINVDDLPYTDNFDTYTTSTTAKTGVAPNCWTLAKQDVSMTDEYKPMIYYSSANAHSGNYSLILNKRGIYAMPQFNGNVNTLQMSFYLKQSMAKYQLQVGVMSNLNNANTFVPIATIDNNSTGIEYVEVDFSNYTGNGQYIAFRNILASGYTGEYSCNYIDNLTLDIRNDNCVISIADMPYSDNFDSYTTSTTTKTGVAPDCWTLVHQDVAMTDEYKPMIYYSSAHSHSGNYSLILNKRGIYAMPAVDCDVSSLQLSMYLRQTMAKYQLQVGVMTNLNDASTFVPVATIDNGSTSTSEHVTVSFTRYTGNGRYIAFRNILASGQSGEYSCNYIDDITLSVRCAIHNTELPWIEGFENHTTSTTAKTGVEPACWTLVQQDVSMTSEYRPMVYYDASCAHSGNYSLILNKRGLYAMPTVITDVNTLQMELYVRQTQAKYQLQVGVLSDLNNASSFVPVATINNTSTTSAERHVINFSSYTGSGNYIAFRNTLASGQTGDYSCNYIDDITLRLAGSYAYDSNDSIDSKTYSATPLTASQPWIKVYPNPTSGMLTVEADQTVLRIDVFDYTGRNVTTVEGKNTLDLSHLASGFYTLRCTLPDRIEVRRVVKQ